jgi:trk system potassium uptake protein
MKIIVVGCGRFGAELAERLFKSGHEVAVIDHSSMAFNNLPPDFQGRLSEGDAMNQDVLHRAGIEEADGLAAVTNSDAYNLIIGRIATSKFHIKNVVARNYDPDARKLYEVVGLQVVSAASWGAQRVEEMLSHGNVKTVFSAGNGEVEIYEIPVQSAMSGRKLGEFTSIPDLVVVSISRTGRAFIPSPDNKLEDGDVLYVSATTEGISEFRERFEIRGDA